MEGGAGTDEDPGLWDDFDILGQYQEQGVERGVDGFRTTKSDFNTGSGMNDDTELRESVGSLNIMERKAVRKVMTFFFESRRGCERLPWGLPPQGLKEGTQEGLQQRGARQEGVLDHRGDRQMSRQMAGKQGREHRLSSHSNTVYIIVKEYSTICNA